MPRLLSPAEIADFRDRLCDAAERMFADHGPEAVTIRQLAAAVGVSPMTPYRYFKDKEAILATVRERAFLRHAEALEGAYAAAPPEGRAAALAEAYIAFALDHPHAYTLMFDINQPNEAEYPDLVRAGQRSRDTMTLHLRDEAAAGRLTGDLRFIAHMYWAALHGPLMLKFSGKLSSDLDPRALALALMASLDRGILGPEHTRMPAPGQAGGLALAS